MKRTHLPLNALRVFDAAARHLSFTRAADELAVTPAAVGQQIRALEDLLGVVLFRRTPKGLELTDEATAGLESLRTGFLHFEDAVRAMQAGQSSHVYTISAPRDFFAAWLAPRLAEFRKANPEVRYSLVNDETADFTEANLDLAIRLTEGPGASDWVAERLAGPYPHACRNPTLRASEPNDRAWRAAEIPGGNGHGTAAALATIYGAMVRRAQPILRPDSLARATAVRFDGLRADTGTRSVWGAGFQMAEADYGRRADPGTFGHGGWGGSLAFADARARLGVDRAIPGDERRAGTVGAARTGAARGEEQRSCQHRNRASHISIVTCRSASGTPALGAGQEIRRGLGVGDRGEAIAVELEGGERGERALALARVVPQAPVLGVNELELRLGRLAAERASTPEAKTRAFTAANCGDLPS